MTQGSKTQRKVTAVFGVLLVALAIAIVVTIDASMIVGGVVAALAIGGLGIEACISAARDRPSLLQRIGPLP